MPGPQENSHRGLGLTGLGMESGSSRFEGGGAGAEGGPLKFSCPGYEPG